MDWGGLSGSPVATSSPQWLAACGQGRPGLSLGLGSWYCVSLTEPDHRDTAVLEKYRVLSEPFSGYLSHWHH